MSRTPHPEAGNLIRHLLAVCALAASLGCATPEATTIPGGQVWSPTEQAAPLVDVPVPQRPTRPDDGPFVAVHYGDSHSSIPAMPATLRDLLAAGAPTSPGFVAPEHHTPEASVAAVGAWTKHNWLYNHHKGPFGPLGVAWSIKQAEGRMGLRLRRGETPAEGVKVTALFARRRGHLPFELRTGERVLKVVEPPEGEEGAELALGAVEVTLPAGETRLELRTLKGEDELRFFGFLVQFPGAKVEYDAFGVVGARIRSPRGRADVTLSEYMALRDPDMVVMWYGSNSAYNKRLDLEMYGQHYQELLTSMRQRAPKALCVAIGPPDLGRTGGTCGGAVTRTLPRTTAPPDQRQARQPASRSRSDVDSQGRVLRRRPGAGKGRRGDGLKKTRRGIKRMSESSLPASGEDLVCEGQGPIPGIVRVQREAAYRAGCAYFDTFAWMGGPGAMQRWARHKPRLAAGDLVHLTIEGYKRVAQGIVELLPELRSALPAPLDRKNPPIEASAPSCPAGASYRAEHGLCVDDDEAIGPFPEAMRRLCEAQGGAGCQSHRWEVEAAVKAYGRSSCPMGSKLDPRLGYCVDHKYAYGPFEADHVAHCAHIGGGEACATLRWPRAITPARPVALARAILPEGRAGAAVTQGACALRHTALEMVWRACDGRLDCIEEGGRRLLRLPSVGPVAMEAHLVTEEDDFSGWPQSSRHGIDAHHARSQAATGYVMRRTQSWAPAGEGGCEYGQGSSPGKVPMLAEAWYINMFWKKRPPRGTRMIVTNPATGRTVVAAAGYETGPGSNEVMAGVSEEIHHYLGTRHRGKLQVAFAVDQSLPFGPIECE